MQLLPPNATALQRKWETAFGAKELREELNDSNKGIEQTQGLEDKSDLPQKDIGDPQIIEEKIKALAGFKANPNANLLPWLQWEYGLEEIIPYIPQANNAIKDGINWQRLRGTPKSVMIGMGWLGFTDAKVESSPIGRHYYRYQIDTHKVPREESISQIAHVAKLSAPVRSKLSRVYHHYDVRNQTLSGNEFGHILSDYSGVPYVDKDGETPLRISFGRNDKVVLMNTSPALNFAHNREFSHINHYLTGVRLNHYQLSDATPERFPTQKARTRHIASVELLASHHKPLVSATLTHLQERSLSPLYLAGAHTGRMNVHYSYLQPQELNN